MYITRNNSKIIEIHRILLEIDFTLKKPPYVTILLKKYFKVCILIYFV